MLRAKSPESGSEGPTPPGVPQGLLRTDVRGLKSDAASEASPAAQKYRAREAKRGRTSAKDAQAAKLREQIRRFQQGEPGSQEEMVQAGEPIIQYALKRYARASHRERDLDDYAQEARLGFLKGCERFDLSTDYRPLTYIWDWIRHHIQRAMIVEGACVRIPVHRYRQRLAVKTRMKAAEAVMVRDIRRSYVKLFSELEGPNSQSSLYDEGVSYEEQIVDENPLVDEVYEEIELEKAIPLLADEFLSGLDERKRYILMQRFGFNGQEPRKLEDIGQEMGVSRERIRQVEAQALQECSEQAQNWHREDRRRRGEQLRPFYWIEFEQWISICLRSIGMTLPPTAAEKFAIDFKKLRLPGSLRSRKELGAGSRESQKAPSEPANVDKHLSMSAGPERGHSTPLTPHSTRERSEANEVSQRLIARLKDRYKQA